MNTKETPFLPKRRGSRYYTIVCEKGHYYGMINAPQHDPLCCVEAMAEALANEVERLWEKCEAAG